ncbi:hypothetical protein GCM10009001_02170 [Virgibacillus siamensis]|uniref:Uncharacterized protein n=1 Tax=Virgibacillus siamensis TaxID=480071 RepID=A0ABP3QF82_9BACI
MVEQEKFKHLLEKLIEDTENAKFQSSEELINALIHELGADNNSFQVK